MTDKKKFTWALVGRSKGLRMGILELFFSYCGSLRLSPALSSGWLRWLKKFIFGGFSGTNKARVSFYKPMKVNITNFNLSHSKVTKVIRLIQKELKSFYECCELWLFYSANAYYTSFASSCMAKHFLGKSGVFHLHEGPEWGRTADEIEKRKSPAPGGTQMHDLTVMRRVLHLCATAAAPSSKLTYVLLWSHFSLLKLRLKYQHEHAHDGHATV